MHYRDHNRFSIKVAKTLKFIEKIINFLKSCRKIDCISIFFFSGIVIMIKFNRYWHQYLKCSKFSFFLNASGDFDLYSHNYIIWMKLKEWSCHFDVKEISNEMVNKLLFLFIMYLQTTYRNIISISALVSIKLFHLSI